MAKIIPSTSKAAPAKATPAPEAKTEPANLAKRETPQSLSNVPDFLLDDQKEGLDQLSTYVVVPRIKIVQDQSSERMLEEFGSGAVIISPDNTLLRSMPRNAKGTAADPSQFLPFTIIPVYFFTEFLTWNDRSLLASGEPMILARSYDPKGDIARKSRDKKLRTEIHPAYVDEPLTDDTPRISHSEHLNFIVLLEDEAAYKMTACLSFARGEFMTGRRFTNLITGRRKSCFAGRYEVRAARRPGKQGQWWGLDPSNPVIANPWVETPELFEELKALHAEFKANHDEAVLTTAYEDEADGGSEAAPVTDGEL